MFRVWQKFTSLKGPLELLNLKGSRNIEEKIKSVHGMFKCATVQNIQHILSPYTLNHNLGLTKKSGLKYLAQVRLKNLFSNRNFVSQG